MRINHNMMALNSYRQLSTTGTNTQKSIEKLSSGLRISKAGDDAAGLAISEKMRGQIRGLDQADRNIQDAVSMVQVAEGGLNEIHSLLQRGRELSVQAANDTTTSTDRKSIQSEINQISKEVDRISSATEFNKINLLNQASSDPKAQQVLDGLKKSWLKQSADTISAYYGINPDAVDLNIKLVAGAPGGVAAYVSYGATGAAGVGTITGLTVELADYSGGKIGGIEADRVIAHEMVHAVMARTMNMDLDADNNGTLNDPVIPTWFKEGTAEFIQGAKERLFADTSGGTSTVAVMNAWGAGWPGGTGTGSSADYSASYAATFYMHEQIKANGGTGIKDIMTYLAADTTRTLNDALTNASSGAFADLADFNASFSAAGGAFIMGFNWANGDTGAVGGLDADGGPVKTDTSVIPDTVNMGDPTAFNEIYPSIPIGTNLSIQLGANQGQILQFSLSCVNSAAMGIDSVDLVTNAQAGISIFDAAITTVSDERGRYGAIQNRLEHALSITKINHENLTASESRIRDLDMANEMMEMTKNNILSQTAQSMLAQANQQPQGILQLLR